MNVGANVGTEDCAATGMEGVNVGAGYDRISTVGYEGTTGNDWIGIEYEVVGYGRISIVGYVSVDCGEIDGDCEGDVDGVVISLPKPVPPAGLGISTELTIDLSDDGGLYGVPTGMMGEGTKVSLTPFC